MSHSSHSLTTGLALVCASCGAFVDASTSQCRTDLDCAALAEGSTCMVGVCVLDSDSDSGQPSEGPVDSEGETEGAEPEETGAAETGAAETGTTGTGSDFGSESEGLDPDPDPRPDPRWTCLDDPVTSTEAEMVELTFSIRNIATSLPPPETTGRICALSDSQCMDPVRMLEFDGDGDASTRVRTGFEGYVELQAPEITPSLVYIPPAWDDDFTRVEIVPDTMVEASAAERGWTFNRDDRGILFAQVYGCDGNRVSGVEFTISNADGSTNQFYGQTLENELLDTPDDGTGGFLNVPPGPVTWTARMADTGFEIGEIRFFHRRGWASLIFYRPN